MHCEIFFLHLLPCYVPVFLSAPHENFFVVARFFLAPYDVTRKLNLLCGKIFFQPQVCYGTEYSVVGMNVKEYFFSAAPSSRIDLGLPADWPVIEDWLSEANLATAGQTIKQLSAPSKDGNGAREFTWDNYPSKGIPSAPETAINIGLLKELVKKNANNLLEQELKRAYRTID
jgi:hypothetical protein